MINARFLTQKITGVQRFAIEISKELKAQFPDKVRFVTPPNILHQELADKLKVVVVGKNTGHLWEQYDLVRYLKSVGNPVLLNLANSAPLFYRNSVVTIHDLAVYHNPNWFSYPYRIYYHFLTPRIVRKATKVITVSHTVKQELIDKFLLPVDKVEVVYNAVADTLKKEPVNSGKENYILTVGSLEPRKNLQRLVLAYLKADLPDHELYIIGGNAAAFADTGIADLIKNDSRIKLLGRVSDSQLHSMYAKAKLFAYVSLYEGFGLPNIEAMAQGVPVLTSDIGAIREVCGDAAWYVNPTSVDDISEGILKLIHSPALLKDQSHKGMAKAKEYNWSASAAKLFNAIQKLDAVK